MSLPLASHETIVPLWLVLPFTGVAMTIITIHWLALRSPASQSMPPLRRRIRLANAALLYALTPLLAYGVGVVTPADNTTRFVYVWATITALAGLVLMLAMIDAWMIVAEHRARLTRLRQEFSALRRPSEGGPRGDSAPTPDAGARSDS
jgi:hypothetical protein